MNKCEMIKQKVNMYDLLLRYGYEPKRRMRCPIHNGDDFNFAITDKTYMCFSHCGGGDVITFVQKMFSLSFQETLRKIDSDFCLNIYKDHTFEELRQSHYQTQALQAKREREKREKQKADDEYWAAFDEWKRLDDNKRSYAPKTPDEELHPLFTEALQKIHGQEYILDCVTAGRKAE